MRYSFIAMDQVRSQRQQRFIAKIRRDKKAGKDYDGTLWRNTSKRKNVRADADAEGKRRIDEMVDKGWYGYDDSDNGTIDTFIAKIRTDLDRFTTAESKILENHGHFCADIAIRAFLPYYLNENAPFKPPHASEEYLDDKRVREHLKHSASRWRFLKRRFLP
jgi:hypothetical protein